MNRFLFLITVVLISVFKLSAYDIEIKESYASWYQTFYYNIKAEGEVEFAKYSTSASHSYDLPTDVTIPEEISYEDKTYKVVSIGKEAFRGNFSITCVYLPYSIKSIGESCFYGMQELSRVKLIGSGVNEVTYIGNGAFHGCLELFDTNVIGNSVTNIGSSAFQNCCHLLSVKIPDSVTTLGSKAFYGCNRLMSASIGKGVRTIPVEAFYGCSVMTSVSIAADVQAIQTSAFEKSGIKSVKIPSSVKSISAYAFRNCTQLASVTLSNSLTEISQSAFFGCEKLTEVAIPASVNKISNAAFYGCASLRKVDFSAATSLTEIQGTAFAGTNISSATIPHSVEKIGNGTFQLCTAMLSVTLGNSLKSIGDLAFANCDRLRQIFSYPMVPPEVSFTTFSANHYDNVTLKVPVEVVADYQNHEVWGLFRNIVGIEGAGIENVVPDEEKTVKEVYTTTGVKVGNDIDNLPAGYYVVRYSDGGTGKLHIN